MSDPIEGLLKRNLRITAVKSKRISEADAQAMQEKVQISLSREMLDSLIARVYKRGLKDGIRRVNERYRFTGISDTCDALIREIESQMIMVGWEKEDLSHHPDSDYRRTLKARIVKG
jgi:hypothetical protein